MVAIAFFLGNSALNPQLFNKILNSDQYFHSVMFNDSKGCFLGILDSSFSYVSKNLTQFKNVSVHCQLEEKALVFGKFDIIQRFI